METCETCKMFFRFCCRKHAPVVLVDGKDEKTGGWTVYPDVDTGGWCGDYEQCQ